MTHSPASTPLLNVSRRGILKGAAGLAGALVLKLPLPARAADGSDTTLSAFLAIRPDGTVVFQNPFIEMGQGTYTAIPQIVAEELDAPLDSFVVEHAPHGPDYKVMFGGTARFTGGSLSVRSTYPLMRKIGATARAMLIEAAARSWDTDAAVLTTEPGFVRHPDGRRIAYAELAETAAGLTPPADPPLKDSAGFRLIGRSVKRTDSLVKSTGAAKFGIDARIDNMLVASIIQPPTFRARLESFDASAAKSMPGVADVIAFAEDVDLMPGYSLPISGIAVLAERNWQALRARETIKADWRMARPTDAFSTDALEQTLKNRLDEPGETAERIAAGKEVLNGPGETIEAVYTAPFLAHATMEPMNCTADVRSDGCTVIAPNQGADYVAAIAAGLTGLPLDAIDVETPYLGGGFGRRFVLDYVAQAILLSKRAGRPVQVVWTREDDTRHDHWRPMTAVKFRARMSDGKPSVLHATAVGEGPLGRMLPMFLQNANIDDSVLEGLVKQPYEIANRQIDYVHHRMPVPIGFWRSVGHSMNGFFTESFIDEMAHAAGRDPVDFRRDLLTRHADERAVLDAAVRLADYRSGVYETNGEKRAMGVALHESFGSLVAQVAEVSIDGGAAIVHRIACAIDVGTAINPAIVEAQIHSGIAYGLSAALMEEVVFENGEPQAGNFDSYPVLTPDRMPEIAVTVMASGRTMGGVGEPGTPPVAPAVTNAVFKLTGTRIRRLPLSRYDLKLAG